MVRKKCKKQVAASILNLLGEEKEKEDGDSWRWKMGESMLPTGQGLGEEEEERSFSKIGRTVCDDASSCLLFSK